MIFLVLLSVFLRGASSSIPPDEPFSFTFPSFDPESCSEGNLICMGEATATFGYLSLTSDPPPESPNQVPTYKVGRVLYSKPVTAWPATINTTFTIRISPYPNTSNSSAASADGMTFVLATNSSPPTDKGAGEYLGLATADEDFPPLALEMDTYKNQNDPDNNHIGIDMGSIISDPVKSLNSFNIDLKSGKPIHFQLYYDGWTTLLYVSAAYAGNPLKQLIERSIVISDKVPSSVYVGFTAATGEFSESHQLLDWTFTSYPLPSSSLKMQNLVMPI